ncbi:MAG TPA: metal ABC transporter ATP-binding protein [Thermomicrobiales bacterium]|nr:metal ABC transporter ATP-binding protein [Thermomicrobiales bacterium]
MAAVVANAIELVDVSAGYDRGPVLDHATLTVARGQFAGIIGPSGAGKTTLLKTVLGLTTRFAGTVTVGGKVLNRGAAPQSVGYVPQVETVDWSFPATVENVVMMGLPNRLGRMPWPSRSEHTAIEAVLEQLGLPGLGRRHIRDLSGGQQHRVFLARALVGQPDILILDEPTSSVDIKTRDDILHHLAHLNSHGTTILMTTHELNSLAAHLPWVICVNRGIVAQGCPSAVFTDAILSRTFDAEMRVIHDTQTGNVLVTEAGSHPPLWDLRAAG